MVKTNNLNNNKWIPPVIDIDDIVTGDMPGDKVHMDESHIRRANGIFPYILNRIENTVTNKFVVSVFGGSGVGKSEVGALIAHYFKLQGFGSYVLSGDNYPHKIPEENDKERLLRYTKDNKDGLKRYLGTNEEINFPQINKIIKQFKNGITNIELKRMGRTNEDIFFETVDFSDINILVLEWTHGHNSLLVGVDYSVFLYSTPAQTLTHRKSRARDNEVDSLFTTMVLDIEQDLLNNQVQMGDLIISKNSEIISYESFNKKQGELYHE